MADRIAKIAPLLLVLAQFLWPPQVAAQKSFFSIHEANSLSSTNEIMSFFAERKISITTYQLPQQVDRYFWVAAYPYSGPDTIDLYCFVHHGAHAWRVQMLYYALHPKTRTLTIIEEGASMIVKDAEQELVRVAIQPGTKLTRCVENLISIYIAKDIWAGENHKKDSDTPKLPDLTDGIERFFHVTNGVPRCPQGGTYVVGRVGELPRCTKGGEGHTLPSP